MTADDRRWKKRRRRGDRAFLSPVSEPRSSPHAKLTLEQGKLGLQPRPKLLFSNAHHLVADPGTLRAFLT